MKKKRKILENTFLKDKRQKENAKKKKRMKSIEKKIINI